MRYEAESSDNKLMHALKAVVIGASAGALCWFYSSWSFQGFWWRQNRCLKTCCRPLYWLPAGFLFLCGLCLRAHRQDAWGCSTAF